MASQQAVKPVNPHHLTAKQLTADKANLNKARAVERVRPRTSKQKNASRHNLVKARAAQKARRSGKKPVAAKQPQAPLDSRETFPDLLTGQNLHLLPVCALTAVAAHLRFWTGAVITAGEILDLHWKLSTGHTLSDLLEFIAVEGFAGMRLESFHQADPDETVPGWVYGIEHPAGYHAVLALPGGMTSWGRVLPYGGQPEEAWHLEWVPL